MSCHLQIDHPKTFEVNNQKPITTARTPLLFRSGSHLFHGMWFQNHWAPDPLFPRMFSARHLETTTNDGSMSNPCRNYSFIFIQRFSLCFPEGILDLFQGQAGLILSTFGIFRPLADPVASPRCFSPNSGPPANRMKKHEKPDISWHTTERTCWI